MPSQLLAAEQAKEVELRLAMQAQASADAIAKQAAQHAIIMIKEEALITPFAQVGGGFVAGASSTSSVTSMPISKPPVQPRARTAASNGSRFRHAAGPSWLGGSGSTSPDVPSMAEKPELDLNRTPVAVDSAPVGGKRRRATTGDDPMTPRVLFDDMLARPVEPTNTICLLYPHPSAMAMSNLVVMPICS